MSTIIEMGSLVTIGFFTLLFLVKLIGNKQLGQVNIFTYISGIVIGSMLADTVLHDHLDMGRSLVAIGFWVSLLLSVELFTMKSSKARKILDNEPKILIKKGEIQYNTLKKQRMNIDELTMMLRTNQAFFISEVEYAILEPNGDLSVLKKVQFEQPNRLEQKIATKTTGILATALISDGKIISQNLIDITRNELEITLKNLNITDSKTVLYAELQRNKQIFIQLYSGVTYLY